jgi:multidrug efflux pump subunit AcrB
MIPAAGIAQTSDALDWKGKLHYHAKATYAPMALVGLAGFFLATGGLFKILPTGFLPDEDQGVFFAAVRLPDGASLERNLTVTKEVEKISLALPGVGGN